MTLGVPHIDLGSDQRLSKLLHPLCIGVGFETMLMLSITNLSGKSYLKINQVLLTFCPLVPRTYISYFISSSSECEIYLKILKGGGDREMQILFTSINSRIEIETLAV